MTSTYDNTGMIAGTNYGLVENIKTSGQVNGNIGTGGIVGLGNTIAEVIGCTNSANIRGDYGVGGISGIYGLITNSGNDGVVTAQRGHGGGISGSSATIIGCYNKGEINGYSGPPGDTAYTSIGGIQGVMGATSYSYNRGKVTAAKAQVGGIIGNCYYANRQVANNCYNTGTLSGSGRVGSIIGQCVGSSFDSCWWTSVQNGSRKFWCFHKFS